MKKAYRRLLSLILAVSIPVSLQAATITYVSAAAAGTSNTSKVVLQKKATIDFTKMSEFDKTGKATIETLKLAKKYYDQYSIKVEGKLKPGYVMLVLGKVAFDGKILDEKTASKLSNVSAAASLSQDSRNFSIAVAAAALAKAPKNNSIVNNMAGVVNCLDTLKTPPAGIKQDAAAFYQYAVSINPKNIDTLVNVGNVYIDLNRQEDARIMFQTALKLVPKYRRAREGMAAYWLAHGDKVKAEKELREDMMVMGKSNKKIEEDAKELGDSKRTPIPSEGESVEELASDIDTLSKLQAVSTADIIEELDPIDAQQIRIKLNNLPEVDKLKLPDINSIMQVNSYDAYFNKTDKFAAFSEEIQGFLYKWAESWAELTKQNLADMNIKMDGDGNVTMPDNLSPEAIIKQSADALAGLSNGDYSGIKDILAPIDPEMAKAIGPVNSTTNPITKYISGYNLLALIHKKNAYALYFKKLQKKYQDIITEDIKHVISLIKDLDKKETAEIAKIASGDGNEEVKRAMIKKIKINYAKRRNMEREYSFHRDFDYMVVQYINVIKPRMEKMWSDCMPHIRMFTEPKSRTKYLSQLSEIALTDTTSFIQLLTGSATADGQYDNVTYLEELAADDELTQALADENEANLQESKGNASKDTEAANIPDAYDALFAILDDLNFKLSAGPVWLKLTSASIEVGGMEIIGFKLGYNWKTDKITGGVGVGYIWSKEVGVGGNTVGVKAELSTMLTYTIDTNTGKIRELDWTGTAKGSLSSGVIKGEAGYTASVMNGNKLNAQVTATMLGDVKGQSANGNIYNYDQKL